MTTYLGERKLGIKTTCTPHENNLVSHTVHGGGRVKYIDQNSLINLYFSMYIAVTSVVSVSCNF